MAEQDACTLLDEDHHRVERLFQQYKAAHDASRKRILTQQVCQELRLHMQVEEEVFYPAFQRAAHGDELVQEANHEHQEARELVLRLEEAQVDDRLMLELEDAILHHVNDEREKMFPQARRTRGLDLMALAQQIESRKAELGAAHPA